MTGPDQPEPLEIVGRTVAYIEAPPENRWQRDRVEEHLNG